MAERQLPKLNVAGSIPVSRSKRINSLPRTHTGQNRQFRNQPFPMIKNGKTELNLLQGQSVGECRGRFDQFSGKPFDDEAPLFARISQCRWPLLFGGQG